MKKDISTGFYNTTQRVHFAWSTMVTVLCFFRDLCTNGLESRPK